MYDPLASHMATQDAHDAAHEDQCRSLYQTQDYIREMYINLMWVTPHLDDLHAEAQADNCHATAILVLLEFVKRRGAKSDQVNFNTACEKSFATGLAINNLV